jgi:hypothetical protein
MILSLDGFKNYRYALLEIFFDFGGIFLKFPISNVGLSRDYSFDGTKTKLI